MNLNYFIQANLGLTILALVYLLLLKNGKEFNFKRAFLLTGILASLLLPLISFQFSFSSSFSKAISYAVLPELWINSDSKPKDFLTTYEVYQAIKIIYVLVAAGIFSRFIFRISQLRAFLKNSELTKFTEYTLLENPRRRNSFSFFRWIFIGQVSSAKEKELIINHELDHVRKYHSLDAIVLEILAILFWFNPTIYILKKILTGVHEFQADDTVIRKHDVNQYCNLLARAALQSADFPIANYFTNSLTLKRIAMIKNEKTKLGVWRLALSLTLFTALLAMVACQDKPNAMEKNSNPEGIYTEVEESAAPTGGMAVFYRYVTRNLKYPLQARKAGVEGKIFVEFVVNQDGTLNDIAIKNGIGAGCDKEAMRIIKESPNWIAAKHEGKLVRQRMILPIVFKLGYSTKDLGTSSVNEPTLNQVVVIGYTRKEPSTLVRP
jgi:TonB family protein